MKPRFFLLMGSVGFMTVGAVYGMAQKPLKPLPPENKSVDVRGIYETIVLADANGLPSGCRLDVSQTRLSQDGGSASFRVISSSGADARFTVYNPAYEFSDTSDTNRVRTLRVASYETRSFDGAGPSYHKTIFQLKSKNGTLVSLKEWELLSLRTPTVNDPEPTDPKAPLVLICE